MRAARRDPARSAIACFLVFFVTALVCFPAYCDRCSFRDIKDALKAAGDEVPPQVEGIPPCCLGGGGSAGAVPAGNPDREAGGKSPLKNVTHSRVPFCIGATLSTITIRSDFLDAIRRSIAISTLRVPDVAVARLRHVVGHPESRAPPAV